MYTEMTCIFNVQRVVSCWFINFYMLLFFCLCVCVFFFYRHWCTTLYSQCRYAIEHSLRVKDLHKKSGLFDDPYICEKLIKSHAFNISSYYYAIRRVAFEQIRHFARNVQTKNFTSHKQTQCLLLDERVNAPFSPKIREKRKKVSTHQFNNQWCVHILTE